MIEEGREEHPQSDTTGAGTPGDMAEALEAMKASSPSMGAALDAAGITPDELTGSHDRATSDAPGTAKPTSHEENQQG